MFVHITEEKVHLVFINPIGLILDAYANNVEYKNINMYKKKYWFYLYCDKKGANENDEIHGMFYVSKFLGRYAWSVITLYIYTLSMIYIAYM